MGMYEKCPCRGCEPPEREPGCHARCEKYLTWKASKQEIKDKIRYEREKEYNAAGLLHDSYIRTLHSMWGNKRTEKERNH